jgi:phosphorylcholine metabolism protein LicD
VAIYLKICLNISLFIRINVVDVKIEIKQWWSSLKALLFDIHFSQEVPVSIFFDTYGRRTKNMVVQILKWAGEIYSVKWNTTAIERVVFNFHLGIFIVFVILKN